MNRVYIYISLLSCIALMSGCLNVEEFEETAQKAVRTFYAEMETPPATKTVLGEKDAEGIRPVLWMLEDKIGVAPSSGAQTFFDVFVNKTTELADTATFEGQTTLAANYYALYPYGNAANVYSDSITFTLSPNQTYKAGSFDQGAFPMVARTLDSDENGFQFQNLCGVLEINLTGTEKVKSLTFSAKRPVSGQFGLNMKYETYPEITPSVSSSNIVTLNCGVGVQLNETTPTPFYLVLPPAEYETFSLTISTADGKVMIKESKKPLTIKRSYVVEASALSFVEAEYIPLSIYETANCYMISEPGAYMFNASVKGNSDESLGIPVSAEVLWETMDTVPADSGYIVQDVRLAGDYITFVSNGVEGNALIAVKDADDIILWSWHIWVTDMPSKFSYINEKGQYTLLDRNLGATRANPGTADQWKESVGTLYQWGRKDPLVADIYARNTSIRTIETSVQYPTDHASLTSWNYASHWEKNHDNYLWRRDVKTIYDPCPPGYTVADIDVYYGIVAETASNGFNVKFDETTSSWFPVTPIIWCGGSYIEASDESIVWASCKTNNNSFYRLHLPCGDHEIWGCYDNAAMASPVRCMRTESFNVELSTSSATEISETSAKISGFMKYLTNEANVTEMGFVWSDSNTTPDINCTKVSVEVQEGDFSAVLTGLKSGTSYSVCTYVVDGGEVLYGNVVNFMTLLPGDTEKIPEDNYEWE